MTETPVKLMRQSTIGTGDICHKRLGYEFNGKPVNMGGEARARGTAYHAGVELWYKSGGDADVFSMHQAAVKALKHEVEVATDGFTWDTSFEQVDLILHKMLKYYVEKGKGWDLTKFTVLATELEFNYPWYNDWVAHGTIDLVLMSNEDGYLYVPDHKTSGSRWRDGKEKARQTPQPAWYSFWLNEWMKATYGEERSILFYFDVLSASTKKGTVGFQRIPATFSKHQQKMVFEKAREYADMVDIGGPFLPNQQHYLCSHLYCDHWYQCPYGESFNQANA